MAAPFRAGEAINRVSAFLTVREQIIHSIRRNAKVDKSTLSKRQLDELENDVMGFDGVPLTVADIGS